MMEYVGYATINGMEAESEYITQAQDSSQAFVMQFAENQVSFQDGQPCPGVSTVTDWDGNTYNTVQIGNQCWMKENLRTTHYADGTSIVLGTSYSDTIAYRYDYTSSDIPLEQRGYLYNWPAVMHGMSSSSSNPSMVQGICPNGWHVPSDAEWTQLTNYVGSNSQYLCDNNNSYIAKSLADTTGWYASPYTCDVGNNQSTNNATGFSALPAGNYDDIGYCNSGHYAYFWGSSDFYSSSGAYSCFFGHDYANVIWGGSSKGDGFSVRCLRD